MIDENLLHERLTAAAAAQDDLLPRALDEDLAGGRRRLRRRKLLAGGGVTAAVAAVAVLAVGVNGWLTTNASPAPDKGPVAGRTSALPTAPDPSATPSNADPDGATIDWPVPAGQGATVPAQDEAFNQRVIAALYAHVDPGKKHLDFRGGGFTIDRQGGTINSGGARIGWRMPGQKGAEGYVGLSVQPKTRAQRPCGSTSEPRMTCHPVKLPNGRTAQLGRKGEAAVVHYQQPDGEWINADVSLLFGNNSQIPVHDVGITDQMLLDLVQDDRLNLPTKAEDAAAPKDKPTEAQVHAAAAEALPGGTLTVGFAWLDMPGSQQYGLNWRKGAVSVTASYSFYKRARFDCPSELGLAKCTPVTLPGGGKLQYAEGVRTDKGKKSYVMGGTYVQPDGDGLSFKLIFPGIQRPAGAPTKEDLLKFFSATHIKK
ncbi:MAG: hypothetical protein QOD39_65 [Mycobacterium sp.]|jgi:hypothetical protein|nr:hypothetical protein [Mycobacterium sp.]